MCVCVCLGVRDWDFCFYSTNPLEVFRVSRWVYFFKTRLLFFSYNHFTSSKKWLQEHLLQCSYTSYLIIVSILFQPPFQITSKMAKYDFRRQLCPLYECFPYLKWLGNYLASTNSNLEWEGLDKGHFLPSPEISKALFSFIPDRVYQLQSCTM